MRKAFETHFLSLLKRLSAPPGTVWVAFSGGRDSHVLLDLLVRARERLPITLEAVHVDHGLQPDSNGWVEHCIQVCEALDVPLENRRLELGTPHKDSLEAVARRARYGVLADIMCQGDLMLTAHHRGDQAETVLLQLLRGSGPEGLAAMPEIAAFPPGFLVRPLLQTAPEWIRGYADRRRLRWVEDPTNQDTGYDRNFLRHKVVPLLEQRWPALGRTLSRSASHCAMAATGLRELARSDLRSAMDAEGRLVTEHLRQLSASRRRWALREWLRSAGLGPPDSQRLARIEDEVMGAAPDREPVVSWPGAEVRRYRDRLYAMRPLTEHDPHVRLAWEDGETPLLLPAGLGHLQAAPVIGRGLDADMWARAEVMVGFRSGGESCRVGTGRFRRTLKKLFQENGVPPWDRGRIPLILLDGQLAAVAGRWVCEPFRADDGRPGVEILWNRIDV